MAIWSRYIYTQPDYWSLINALRQRNRYRYGCLLKEKPAKVPRHARAFEVPDGVVVLARDLCQDLPLQDLEKPLYLLPFFIVWNSQRQRLRLQISRDFVRLKIHIIDDASRHEYRWVNKASVKTQTVEFIAFCNQVTTEVQEAGRYCWVEPQSLLAYDRQVRKIVMRWLTTVARVPVNEAKQTCNQYLRRWWRGAETRNTKVAQVLKGNKAMQRLEDVLG